MKEKQSIPGAFMWPLLVAVPVVTLIAVAVIASLRQRADESQGARFILARLDGQASYLDVLASEAASKRDPGVDLRARAEAARRDLTATLRELQHDNLGAVDDRLLPPLQSFLTAALRQTAGDADVPRGLSEVAGRYDALHSALVEARASCRAIAEHESHVADFGSGATLAAAVLGICLLFLQLDRTRQTIRTAVAEEGALRRSESRFRSLVQNASDAIVVLDLDGTVRYASPSTHQSIGCAPEALVGTNLFAGAHPDDLPKLQAFYADALCTRGITPAVEFRFRSGAHWRSLEAIANNCLFDPAVSGMVMNIRDLTDRRRSEEILRQIATRARCLLWHAEVEEVDGMLRWNVKLSDEEAAQRFLALDVPPGGSYVEAWDASRRDEDRERYEAFAAQELRAGRSYAQRFRCCGKDGEQRCFAEDVEVEAVGPGRWRAVGVCTDITEQELLERQLLQSQKMEAIGRLAGGVAHDFNNMLAVIGGYCEILLARPLPDEPVRRCLGEIHKAELRAAELTRQLLAFSRRQVLEPKVLDLNDVIAGMETMLHRLIGEDVELVTQFDPSLGRVKADPGQLQQVLMNLSVNARDAIPQGGRLMIRTRNVPRSPACGDTRGEPGPYVLLEVSDTGSGMDRETLSRIFEPFFTTKGDGRGTGLGLATVYGIVRQSGGQIDVASEPGRGTTFRIYLPWTGEAAPFISHAELPAAGCSGPETVLLVEDEEMVRHMVSNVLQAKGYRVLAARHGEAALEISAEHQGPIDLLLTDVVMPGMSGRELAEQITSERPDLASKVIYMSGYTDDAVVRHGLLAAEVAFLQKPFSPDALACKVREVLDAPLVA